jgi:predicted HTH domain antitoxin
VLVAARILDMWVRQRSPRAHWVHTLVREHPRLVAHPALSTYVVMFLQFHRPTVAGCQRLARDELLPRHAVSDQWPHTPTCRAVLAQAVAKEKDEKVRRVLVGWCEAALRSADSERDGNQSGERNMVREEDIVRRFARGEISGGFAARVLEIPLADFMDALRKYGVPYSGADDDAGEISDELENLARILRDARGVAGDGRSGNDDSVAFLASTVDEVLARLCDPRCALSGACAAIVSGAMSFVEPTAPRTAAMADAMGHHMKDIPIFTTLLSTATSSFPASELSGSSDTSRAMPATRGSSKRSVTC